MKLSVIQKPHMLQAAEEMDREQDNSWAEYWVELGNGKEYQFRHLIKKAYQIATGTEIGNDFFQSNEGYRSYITKMLGFKVVFKVPDNVDFFNADELIFFSGVGGKQYRKGNKEHEVIGKRIKAEIFNKTNVWGRLLNLEGWKCELDNIWQISGNFKSYSWARLYKNAALNKKVFFTIGVDAEEQALLYKLDCQRSQYSPENSLSSAQIHAFDRIRNGTGAEWNLIEAEDLNRYNWEKLRQLTVDFISKYESLYDEAVVAVHETRTVPEPLSSEEGLIRVSIPHKAFDKLPQKKYSFKGATIDYDGENKKAKEIGDGGEHLVLKLERKLLIDNGFTVLANKVKKVKDGEGYDILSYDFNGNEKYIEVKTTTGIATRPFIMTDNEWEFMKRESEHYYLYRIFNYDKESKSGSYFCIEGNIDNAVFKRPKQYEIFLKNEKLI